MREVGAEVGASVSGSDFRYYPVSNTAGNSVLVLKDDGSNGTLDICSEIVGNANAASSALTFRVSSVVGGRFEAMRILNDGGIGIGTTSIFSLAHIGSHPGSTNPSTGSILTVSNDGITGIDLGANVNANSVVGRINWVNYMGVGNYNTARIDAYADGNSNSGSLRFWTASVSSSPTIRLTIASTGAATFSSSVTAARFSSQEYFQNVTSTPSAIFDSGGGSGVWMVTVVVTGNGPQVGYAIVGQRLGGTLYILSSGVGGQVAFSVSGNYLQLAQTAGGSISTSISVMRINQGG